MIVICDEGYQSSLAAATLREFGLDATDVIGGVQAWRREGQSSRLTSRDGAPPCQDSLVDTDARAHWQQVYEDKAPDEVSWYEPVAQGSLALIAEAGLALDDPILDIGCGTSGLAADLLNAGYSDITVADISGAALERSKTEFGAAADRVAWVEADVREHDFARRFALWHDRAAFHFMVDASDREAYLANLRRSLDPGGRFVLAAFGPDGPSECSGLPVTRYGAPALTDLFPDFELLSSRLQLHHTPSGTAQQFLYAHLTRAG